MEVFDEDKAVKYILDNLKSNGNTAGNDYDEDDILEVIDIIWDYYEDNGFLDVDMEDTPDKPESADKEKLMAHVVKMVKKDRGTRLALEDIPAIVEAELAYEALCDEL